MKPLAADGSFAAPDWPTPLGRVLAPFDLALNRPTHERHPFFAIGENGGNPFKGPHRELDSRPLWPALFTSHTWRFSHTRL
jgi:hypothetical protein